MLFHFYEFGNRSCSLHLLFSAVCRLQIWQWDIPLQKPSEPKPQKSPSFSLIPKSQNANNTAPRSSFIPISAAPLAPVNGKALSTLRRLQSTVMKPQLLGLLHCLPSQVTTVSACMATVAVGSASAHGKQDRHATGMIAAATVGGSVEIVTFSSGPVMPLAAHVSVSLGESHACASESSQSSQSVSPAKSSAMQRLHVCISISTKSQPKFQSATLLHHLKTMRC